MERGSLYTELGRGLFFLPPGGKVGFWDTKRSVEQHGGVVCPVCGKEMEKAHVITKNSIGLFFMPGEKDLRTFYTRRNIEADGGIVLDGPMTFRYNRTWLPAWVCRTCKKIVMEYW